MKEVHYLCLQLETMMKEDVLVEKDQNLKFFGSDNFDHPSDHEEQIL